jgi:predicted small secreted protein
MIALLLVASVISLAGCNTMHGLGKDIEQVGEKMQKKSQ